MQFGMYSGKRPAGTATTLLPLGAMSYRRTEAYRLGDGGED